MSAELIPLIYINIFVYLISDSQAVWKYSVERSHALRHLALAFISSQASHDALFSLK